MKIKTKHKVIIPLLLLASILIIIIFTSPKLKGLLNPGDNIKIHFKLSINDKDISLDHAKISLLRNDKKKDIVQKNGILSAYGKEYGEYHFRIIIDSNDIPNYEKDLIINLRYINSNNWYISNTDCKLSLNTSVTGIITGESIVNIKYNDGSSQNYNRVINIEDDEININWGL